MLFTYSGPHSEACWSYGKLPLVLRITIANKRILFWCDLSWCRPGAAVKAAGRSWTTLCLTGHSLLSDCTSSSPTVLWLGTALMAGLVAVNAVGTETEALFDVRLNHVGLWCLCQRRQGNVVRWGTLVLIVGERILSHHFLLLELHLWQASCWCILGEKDQVLESLQCISTAGCLYSFYNFFIHIYSNINYFSHPKEAWLYHPEILNTTRGDSFILDDDKQPGLQDLSDFDPFSFRKFWEKSLQCHSVYWEHTVVYHQHRHDNQSSVFKICCPEIACDGKTKMI